MMKPCPACRTLVPANEWVQHQQEHRNQGKGSSDSRGYDAAHRALRKNWAIRIESGEYVECARCGEQIMADETDWRLDHVDDGPQRPSHFLCNQQTSTHRAAGERM